MNSGILAIIAPWPSVQVRRHTSWFTDLLLLTRRRNSLSARETPELLTPSARSEAIRLSLDSIHTRMTRAAIRTKSFVDVGRSLSRVADELVWRAVS